MASHVYGAPTDDDRQGGIVALGCEEHDDGALKRSSSGERCADVSFPAIEVGLDVLQ